MTEAVLQFLYGGLTTLCILVGFFFLRFWHTQRDPFFLWFMVAFWSIGASWGVHLIYATSEETGANVYVFRLVAFVLIIVAIVDKNRRAASRSQ
jgi:hypothetical protein